MSKIRNREGRKIPFFVRWFILLALENFVPFVKNKIAELPSLRQDVKNWLVIQLEIVNAVIFAILDLNNVGLTTKERLLMVFDAFYGKQFRKKRHEIFGQPLTFWTEFITRSALTFVEPWVIRKINAANIEREDVKAWLVIQVTVAGDIAEEVSKGKEGLKDRLYKLFQDYVQ